MAMRKPGHACVRACGVFVAACCLTVSLSIATRTVAAPRPVPERSEGEGPFPRLIIRGAAQVTFEISEPLRQAGEHLLERTGQIELDLAPGMVFEDEHAGVRAAIHVLLQIRQELPEGARCDAALPVERRVGRVQVHGGILPGENRPSISPGHYSHRRVVNQSGQRRV